MLLSLTLSLGFDAYLPLQEKRGEEGYESVVVVDIVVKAARLVGLAQVRRPLWVQTLARLLAHRPRWTSRPRRHLRKLAVRSPLLLLLLLLAAALALGR
jgi:hypothetical protein